MKTKILICALAVATLAVGSAACGKKKSSGNGAPAFPDPPSAPTQIDRMGRPAINTVLKKVLDTTGTLSNAFNGLNPSQDVSVGTGPLLQALGLAHACPAPAVKAALLPDVLTFTTTSNANYGALQGRALADDVFDITLAVLYTNSNGAICSGATPFLAVGDRITANDKTFGTTFPFLAAPN